MTNRLNRLATLKALLSCQEHEAAHMLDADEDFGTPIDSAQMRYWVGLYKAVLAQTSEEYLAGIFDPFPEY